MAQIDISNYVTVSISKAPTSISERNVSIIALFTKETANVPMGDYVIYKNPTSAGNDWGVNSETYKMINAIFSQQPNILLANGYVIVFPMKSNITVQATNGTVECNNLIYSNFTSIDNGSISVNIDNAGVEVLSNLDFTACQSLSDVANVFNTVLNSLNATCQANETSLIFQSNSTGTTSTVVLESDTTGTDLTTVNLLNTSQAIITNGQAEYTGVERLQDVILRCENLAYYGVAIPTYDVEDNEIYTSALTMQSLNHILIVAKSQLSYANNDSSNVFYNIQKANLDKTRCLYYGIGDCLVYASAYASSYCAINFNGSDTVKNLNAKELIGILPDKTINDNLLQNFYNIGVDVYAMCGGVGSMYCSGKNEWFDTVLCLQWLKIQLENAGFTALRNVPTKIAQTPNGIKLLENSYEKVLNQAVRNGFIASGKWTLPYTFGDQELFYNNIEQVGYYIYSNPLSEQSQEERDNRIAPLCQIAIKLAGAINKINIIVYVNN